jgi:hypothetical protein
MEGMCVGMLNTPVGTWYSAQWTGPSPQILNEWHSKIWVDPVLLQQLSEGHYCIKWSSFFGGGAQVGVWKLNKNPRANVSRPAILIKPSNNLILTKV